MGIIGVASDSSLAPLSCGCTYYKCASVTPGVSGAVIEVAGDTTWGCNGTYTIVDATATGTSRVWLSENGAWRIQNTAGPWDICSVSQNQIRIRASRESDNNYADNPWEASVWKDTNTYEVSSVTLTPYDTAKTWTGYKAVFDSTAGTWSFEDTLTEGLTYTSVTPQVGSTYNADVTLTVMLHNLLFSDIIAYYKFDDNLNNYVSQYGTATSNNTTYVDGKSGKALLFNGSTSKCIVPKDISVRGRSRVSVSLWFNINSFGNKNVLYAEENKKTHFFRFGLEVLSTGNIVGALRNFDSDATYKSIDGGSVSLQEWHFAVFTFDAHSQIAKLHVDGVLKGTVATSSDPIPDTAPARTISVGYFDGSTSNDTGVIDGMIDELCIWSKALTDTEVSELYNNGAGKFL